MPVFFVEGPSHARNVAEFVFRIRPMIDFLEESYHVVTSRIPYTHRCNRGTRFHTLHLDESLRAMPGRQQQGNRCVLSA